MCILLDPTKGEYFFLWKSPWLDADAFSWLSGHGPGVGAMLAGGAAAAAAALGASHMGHGGGHYAHGAGHYGHGHGVGHYGHGKFKHGKHGKFKHGKFGKHGKHKGHGMFGGKFKKWKWSILQNV